MTKADNNALVQRLERALGLLSATYEIVYVRRPLETLLDDQEEITGAQLRTLSLLSNRPDQNGMLIGAISEGLRISYPAASKAVDRLTERGLAERSRSVGDARQIRVRLTTKGAEVVQRIRNERQQKLLEVMGQLGDQDTVVRFLSMLETLVDVSLSHRLDLEEVRREWGL